MKRRSILQCAATGLAGAPLGAHAQPQRPPRLAFLFMGSPPQPGQPSSVEVVRRHLLAHGHAQIETAAWYAGGQAERLGDLAQQMLQWQPDLILAQFTPAAVAAQRATRDIPIVMLGVGDAVGSGLVQSLARPGANVTGVSAQGAELAVKSIELLRELRPGLRRLGALVNDRDPFTPALLRGIDAAAAQLRLPLQVERLHDAARYAATFQAWVRGGVEAVFVQPSLPQQPAIDLARQHQMPSCSMSRAFVVQGGLLAYIPGPGEIDRLAAETADRILRGAAPATLPVQQNMRFALLLNLRTAAALRIEVPPALRLRVDEVFE